MEAIVLQSGSHGNCVYVDTGSVRLLIDAGISGRRAQQRLAAHGRDIHEVDAVLISHDHCDHVTCAGIYQRKFHLPVYMTGPTHAAATARYPLGRMEDVRSFASGQTLTFGDVRVETLPTPHDGADATVFIIDDGNRRLGVMTDLGHVFDKLGEAIATLDAVILESNYDPDMLAAGRYPVPLQRRIRGPGGHLSNPESAKLVHTASGPRLQWVCLAHLSEDNNHPMLATETHHGILGRNIPLLVAGRYEPTPLPEL